MNLQGVFELALVEVCNHQDLCCSSLTQMEYNKYHQINLLSAICIKVKRTVHICFKDIHNYFTNINEFMTTVAIQKSK